MSSSDLGFLGSGPALLSGPPNGRYYRTHQAKTKVGESASLALSTTCPHCFFLPLLPPTSFLPTMELLKKSPFRPSFASRQIHFSKCNLNKTTSVGTAWWEGEEQAVGRVIPRGVYQSHREGFFRLCICPALSSPPSPCPPPCPTPPTPAKSCAPYPPPVTLPE